MAFSDAEIQEIKNLLGYGSLTVTARPYFDIALVFEEVIKTNIDAWGENHVRTVILVNIRAIDSSLAPTDIGKRMKATEVDEVTLNPNELRDRQKLRRFWLERLSETVKVPIARLNGGNAVTQY